MVPGLVDSTGLEPVTAGVDPAEVTLTSTSPCPRDEKQNPPNANNAIGRISIVDTSMIEGFPSAVFQLYLKIFFLSNI